MAQTTALVRMNKFAYADSDRPSEVVDISQRIDVFLNASRSGNILEIFYAGLNSWPSSLKNNRLYSAKAVIKTGKGYRSSKPAMAVAENTFDPATLTWTSRPSRYGGYRLVAPEPNDGDTTLTMDGDTLTDSDLSLMARQILQTKTVYFYAGTFSSSVQLYYSIYKKLDDNSAPYIEITYDDSVKVNSKITENGCPTSGYFDPRNARKFSWTFEIDDTYYCAGAFTQQSAVLHWRVSGSTWNTISASGSTQNVTVPANTFPTNSTIEWYLTGTDTNGCASTSPTYTISTAADLLTATPIAPVNSVEDGSGEITFRWELEDAPNTTGVRLYYKLLSSDSFSILYNGSTDGAITSWKAPANTFPAGTVYWGIRAYNRDSVYGNLKQAQFLSVAAPAAPVGLAATPVPFTTISWQIAEQQAYRITIDGTTAATGFGTAKSYSVAEPLADGIHVIGVSVQGLYGMWSEESTTSISIENSAEGSVTLTGVFDIDADLTWESTESNAAAFYVYRDGDRIASTAGTSYTDRVALGAHSYTVLQKLEDGNYLQSEPIAGEMTVRSPMIGLLYEAGWLQLRLSENSDRTQGFTYSRKHSLRHIAGTAYPYLEISPYEDASGSYDCAFVDTIDAQTFDAMKGKPVIMKNMDGSVIVGLLASLQKTVREFYFSYSFTIQQIHWEGFIHADD